jgi:nucleotide-binding universal stress UspA family protein
MQPRILVPCDFGPATECAVRWAAGLQRSIGGGSITLVHVLSAVPIPGGLEEAPLLPPTEANVKQAEAALREVAARLTPGAAVAVLLGNHVPSGILATANAWPADLIVMGTHGRSGMKRLVMGSVADYLIRHARCPVVTMRAPRDGSTAAESISVQ